jgi:nucleoside-diphosphate-sugar epimerase
VVSAIVVAARSNVEVGTYFLANHKPVQWRDLFMCAAEACGRRLRLDIEAPMGLARLAALAGDGVGLLTGRPALLSSGKLALSTPRFWVCSAAAARSALGLRESATIAEGFRETCEWYRHAHWLPG